MIDKCIEYINCPTELGLYFETKTPTTIMLREHIACQYAHGGVPSDLKLTITIAPYTTITVIDNLCCCNCQTESIPLHHKLNFHIHKHSTLNYHLGKTTQTTCKKSPQKTCNVTKEINLALLGQHAQAHATCACMGTGTSRYNFTTMQEHKAPQTTSSLTIKSALADQSWLKSQALIKVHKGCSSVYASQINKNLILGSGARALSIPRLEIETDDVQCRHDATISKINQEQLFYLQSRGVDSDQAQKNLIQAFLG